MKIYFTLVMFPDITHIKVNYGCKFVILDLIELKFHRIEMWDFREVSHFVSIVMV